MSDLIKATNPKTNGECEVNYDFGGDLDGAIAKVGKEIVYDYYKSQATVRLQAGLRSCMERGVDPVAFAAGWMPGTKAPSVLADPHMAAKAALSRMSDEEKLELLREMGLAE